MAYHKMTDGWKILQDHIVYVKDNRITKGIEPLDGDKCRTVYVYKRNRFGCANKVCPSPNAFKHGLETGLMYMKAKESIYD